MIVAQHECPECHAAYEAETNTCPTCGVSLSAHPSGMTDTGTGAGEWQDEGPVTDDQGLFLGRFRDREVLGSGAFGEVYKGFDVVTGETVAIKVLWPKIAASPQLERFRRETRLARKLAHENIRQVYELSSHEGVYFLTMELLEGVPLRDVLREARKAERGFGVARALSIAKGLLRGLDHAHARGVLHRDIKPENLFLIGEEEVVKVLDFSVAKRLDDAHHTVGIGTRFYMAPEQMVDDPEEPVDGRADIFAAGVVLYEMLAGQRPFKTAFAVMLDQTPPAPSSLREEVPVSLDTVVLRALAVRAADRYTTAGEMLADIEWIEGEEAGAQTWMRMEQEAGKRRGRLVGATLGALALATLILGGVSLERWWWSRERMQLATVAHEVGNWFAPEGESELDALDEILARRPGYGPARERREALFEAVYARAEDRLDRGVFEEAAQELLWLQALRPGDGRVRSFQSRIANERGTLDGFLSSIETLTEVGVFVSSEDGRGALDLLAQAAERYPDSAEVAETRERVVRAGLLRVAEAEAGDEQAPLLLARLAQASEGRAELASLVAAVSDVRDGKSEGEAQGEEGGLLVVQAVPEFEAQVEPEAALAPGSVDALLARADALIADRKYTTPAADNAYEVLREVLARDPGNRGARERLAVIQRRYIGIAVQRRDRGELDAALSFLGRGAAIQPGDPALMARIRTLRDEIRKQRSSLDVVPIPEAVAPVAPPSPEPEEERGFWDNLFGTN